MNYQQLIDNLSPEIYQRLKGAVETGKWPDGQAVSVAQREHALQAIIAWDQKYLGAEERVGFIDSRHKKGAPAATTLRWKD